MLAKCLLKIGTSAVTHPTMQFMFAQITMLMLFIKMDFMDQQN